MAQSIVVLIVFITAHDKHLHQRHLLTEPSIEIFKGLPDSTRSDDWLRWAGTVRTAPCEVLKVDSGATGRHVFIGTAASTATTTGWGALSSSHLILAQVRLHILCYHLVKHRCGNVLQGLAESRSHLIFNLSLEEVIQALTLKFEIQIFRKGKLM